MRFWKEVRWEWLLLLLPNFLWKPCALFQIQSLNSSTEFMVIYQVPWNGRVLTGHIFFDNHRGLIMKYLGYLEVIFWNAYYYSITAKFEADFGLKKVSLTTTILKKRFAYKKTVCNQACKFKMKKETIKILKLQAVMNGPCSPTHVGLWHSLLTHRHVQGTTLIMC